MSNEKHYPTHPGAEHPPIMTCKIPLEEYESLKRENAELKAKLESVQATAYAESVDAGMENRRLKRALWHDRAIRAEHMKNLIFEGELIYHDDSGEELDWRIMYRKWERAETACRAKAEEYYK
jgi:hypothetical protein